MLPAKLNAKDGTNATSDRKMAPNSVMRLEILLQVVRRGLARADAGDEAAVLLDALGDVVRVELDLRVEEREREDQQAQHEDIHPAPRPGAVADVLRIPAVGIAAQNSPMMRSGRLMIANAKMSGMTPLPEILMGMTVDCPPYILRPLTCLAYCTGMRRSARSTATMSAKMTTAMTQKTMMEDGCRNRTGDVLAWIGDDDSSVRPAVEMMPRKMISEMPLPTPYSVMRSPSHMVSMAPAEYRMTI